MDYFNGKGFGGYGRWTPNDINTYGNYGKAIAGGIKNWFGSPGILGRGGRLTNIVRGARGNPNQRRRITNYTQAAPQYHKSARSRFVKRKLAARKKMIRYKVKARRKFRRGTKGKSRQYVKRKYKGKWRDVYS